ncbi:MAG: nucleoside phosphorylase [Salinivenus sp.]
MSPQLHEHAFTSSSDPSPLLQDKACDEPSVFQPENLLREARRQNDVEHGSVPDVCLLDPDGDIVDHLQATDRAEPHSHWPGYHTTLYKTDLDGHPIGVLGRAVGSSFAALVAEQLFAAGCGLLLSITSAGQIVSRNEPPYFVLIEKALRDEGTSHHYRSPSEYAALNSSLRERLRGSFSKVPVPVHGGASWTTDAPYRETDPAISAAKDEGILAVEMEAAALYAFAEARGCPVVCFAHVTNQMVVEEGDFEKGEADGVREALALVRAAIAACEDLVSDE